MCIYRHHPLLHGLLAELPDPGTPFPAAARSRWLDALHACLDLLYGDAPVEPQIAHEHEPGAVRLVPVVDLPDETDQAAEWEAHHAAALEGGASPAEAIAVADAALGVEVDQAGIPRLPALRADLVAAAEVEAHPPLEQLEREALGGRTVEDLEREALSTPPPPAHGAVNRTAAHRRSRRLQADADAADEARQAATDPRPVPKPGPLDRDQLTGLMGPTVAADAPVPLRCPWKPADDACGWPCADVDELDRHLRRRHKLRGAEGREAEHRADLIETALEDQAAEIAARATSAAATLAASAATGPRQETTP